MTIPNPTHYLPLVTRGQAEDTAPASNYDGTISGATHSVDGPMRGCYDFNGSTNYIKSLIPNMRSGDRSISILFKIDTTTGTDHVLYWHRDEYNDGYMFTMGSGGDGKLRTIFELSGSQKASTVSSSRYDDNDWHLALVVFERGVGMRVYVDGGSSPVCTGDCPTGDVNPTADFYIGYNSATGGTTHWDGGLAETGVFDEVISTTDFADMWNSGSPKFWNQVTGEWEEQDSLRASAQNSWNFNGNDTDNLGSDDATTNTADLIQSGLSAQGYDFVSANSDNIQFGNIGNRKSISLWVNLDSTTENIFEHAVGSGLSASGGTLSYSAWDNVYVDGVDTDTITTGWHHILLTSTTDVACSAFTLGRISSTYGDLSIDEVYTYSTDVSASATNLYNSGTGKVFDKETQTFIDGDTLRIGVEGSYSFDDNILDNTINNNDLTNYTSTSDTTNQKIGSGCRDFSGSNQYLTSPITNDGYPMSVGMWMYPETDANGGYFFVNKTGITHTGLNLYSQVGNQFVVILGDGSGSGASARRTFTWSGGLTVDIWSHILVTVENISTVTLYINGVDQGAPTTSGTGSAMVTGGTYRIGGNSESLYWYTGKLDEIVYFTRIVSQTEITALYNTNTGLAWPYSTTAPPVTAGAIFFAMNF